MKNKLIDLNNHLFAQLERLSDEDTTGTSLDEEIKRAKAISYVATHIIGNAKLALDAAKAINDGMIKHAPLMLGIEGDEDEKDAEDLHK